MYALHRRRNSEDDEKVCACVYTSGAAGFFPALASLPSTEEKVLTKITARDQQVQAVLNRLHKVPRDFKMTSHTCTHQSYSKR